MNALVPRSPAPRGGSEGLYDEGFEPDRSACYSCDPALSIPGANRALRDMDAAMRAILAIPFVDRERVVIGGQSRGGILSVAYAAEHSAQVKGVINFVRGVDGHALHQRQPINQTLFTRGARYTRETLWLYGAADPFYPLSHSREKLHGIPGDWRQGCVP